ncbi:MAG: baseplate J/gp47 family protein [Patescibacteria group bacterium]
MAPKKTKLKNSKRYQSFIITFIILTLTLFLFVIYYSFSKTVIYITQKQQEIKSTIEILVKENPLTPDQAEENMIPGLLLQKETEGTKTFNLDAGQEIPSKASGQVTLYNNWSQVQPLAANTRLLSSSGVLFRTTDRVDVPAKGSLEVTVTADQEGKSGNIEPEKFSVPGLSKQMQELVYGESQTAMTGGLRTASVVTAEEAIKGQNDLVSELKKQAIEELNSEVKEKNIDYTLPENSITYEVTGKTITPDLGQETDKFTLDLKIKLIAVAFSLDDLDNLAKENLNGELEEDQKITDESFIITYTVTSFDLENKSAVLKVSASGTGQIKLSSAIFNRDNLVNKDRQQIMAYFDDYNTIEKVEVKFSPFWVFKAPALKDHIEIKFK